MMKECRLILHPGHSKAGSTSIQNYLFDNLRSYRDLGVGVVNQDLEIAGSSLYGKKNIPPVSWVQQAHGSDDERDILKNLEKLKKSSEKKGVTQLIFSAENLCNLLDREDGKRLHRFINEIFDDVRVIYYVRRQDDFYLSSWQQWGHKEGLSIDQFVQRRLAIHKPDYLLNCNVYSDIYGAEALQVIPFTRACFYNQSLLDDFMYRADVERISDEKKTLDENKGLNYSICQTLSKLHHHYKDHHDPKIKELLLKSVETELLTEKDKYFLSTSLRKKIMDHYKGDNQELCERYLVDLGYEELFGLAGYAEETELESLKREVASLKDVVAIQMDMLLGILKK